ncbi:DUF72 domain-containing protein [Ramlibacter sp. XY19]|uniref:DUF72 domain-containing protein n=1 Tax=Ramlibacter paludis TaxID=2908000 RepID=UPI0023DCD71D|nr:DUF72 domain-containing protein [Ramlibacter paludis]MCG2594645.1 DUF72 domain-containing protein [Ramlibacter paludis]
MSERIYVGVGGWTYEPWRDNFYPKGLPQAQELHYASRHLTAIEVNGTFYSTFKPPTFAKWRDETPDGFMFSLKAHRFATHRRELATAGESIERFTQSGLVELGDKLGPIVWQFMPTKQFDAGDVEAFLKLLPRELKGRPLRHVLDARHPSFATEEYLDLLAKYDCTTVYADSEKYPAIPHARSPLAYLRLMRTVSEEATGYQSEALERWAQGAREWVAQDAKNEAFVFFISGAKERAPAAAQAFLKMV